MNHFTPFLPAAALLKAAPISDERASNLEERLLTAFRMRLRTQRRAEAALLVATALVLAFSFAARV
ncbi:hypothetical protein RLPCCGM1_c1298 [Rhizobium leguminosarum bv. phaseoli CCGM1]|uniref:hypothetical protein n=1 Tax=Rhizobium phaseoli TaxID=396 RepID=UPI0004D8DFB2|nr:hypothetical protein [Rhizobium phaseoli]KEC73182.1 hypothetical protein RLPCCGM1_c1298 [Rhizobium leguminosarum bv. phaseoli CCGM1]PWI54150.1 hypothetical protein B5K03_11965 [Rhizobium phaseoli]